MQSQRSRAESASPRPSAQVNNALALEYEDAKGRIIASLFDRRDDDGALIETYITHVRILESSQYPGAVADLNSVDPESFKHRFIIVAVKKNGRVRVLKSRENANGTFSVGKAWNLDDLQVIEDGEGSAFLITLLKPYYWLAHSLREKTVFLTSLIKIYRKYTGGKSPTLIGFPSDLLSGLGNAQSAQNAAHIQGRPSPSPSPSRQLVYNSQQKTTSQERLALSEASHSSSSLPLHSQHIQSNYTRNVGAAGQSPYPPAGPRTSGWTETVRNVSNPLLSQPIEFLDNDKNTLNQVVSAGSPSRDSTREYHGRPKEFNIPTRVAYSPKGDTSRQSNETEIQRQRPMSMSMPMGGHQRDTSGSSLRRTGHVSRTSSRSSIHSHTSANANDVPIYQRSPPPTFGHRRLASGRQVQGPSSTGHARMQLQDGQGDSFLGEESSRLMESIEKSLGSADQLEQARPQISTKKTFVPVPSGAQTLLGPNELDLDDIFQDEIWERTQQDGDILTALHKERNRLEEEDIDTILQNCNRIEDLGKLVDRAIAECDDMENILTLYAVELETRSKDVEEVESQRESLRLKLSNKSRLRKYLRDMLESNDR